MNADPLPSFPAAIVALAVALVTPACDPVEPAPAAARAWHDLDDLDHAPAPDAGPVDFFITKITTGGAGCPVPGSVSTVVSADKKLLRLIFHDMLLQDPPGPDVKSIGCTAVVELHVPAGTRVAPGIVVTGGYAYLEPGIKARQTTRYGFVGADQISHQTNLGGYHDDYYDVTRVIPNDAAVWSPCGGPAVLAIDVDLDLDAGANPGGQAVFELDNHKILHWKSQQC